MDGVAQRGAAFLRFCLCVKEGERLAEEALRFLTESGLSLGEIQKYINDGVSLEELAETVRGMVERGEPLRDGEGEIDDILPPFTVADFRSGAVFEWLETIASGFQRTRAEYALRDLAKKLKFNGFPQMLKEYRNELKRSGSMVYRADGVSEFADQALDLNVGEWTADESGIWKYDNNGRQLFACSHPVMPVMLLRSIDTGLMKVKLAFRRSYSGKKPWSEVTVPVSRISKAADIVALADSGISVTSGERAQNLVDFLRDALDLNQGVIPEVKSVSRMGWNEDGFAPYLGDVAFDSADSFRPIYRAITKSGDFSQWLEEARDARTYSVTARIVLAASFASVLVEPLGCLPFFVHLWSMDSGTGKTVAQMLGASVWANPAAGGSFFQTFKSTSVGVELMAGFLHSMPLFLDELQLARDRHGRVNFNVYELSAGSGKLRGNRSLGLDYTPKWSNCFITSGESPIVHESDGAGAVNRVIEIECKAGQAVIRDGHRTANALKRNYGHAGRMFIDELTRPKAMERAGEIYERHYTNCIQSDTTEKQAMAAAILLTADELATEWIFRDGRALTAAELGEFLKEKSAVSASERGYSYICGWIAANERQFEDDVERGEHYGLFRDGYAVINRAIWERVCQEAGISSKALLSHLKTKGLLLISGKGYTKNCRIDKHVSVPCVWLRLPADEDADDDDGLPL